MFRIELLFIFSFITCHSRILQCVEFKNLGVTNSRGSWVVGTKSRVMGAKSWVQSLGRGCKVNCPPRGSVRFCGTTLTSE